MCQAWRYWWREALQKNVGWSLSPITRDNKIAFTEANPLLYADDDVFGYMKAVKEEVLDEKGKAKKVDATVTRVSPLKNSAIVSVGSARTVENWSSMARQDGDSVPYSKEEYSAIMKGMFSLDLAQLGTFASYNKTGFKNITQKLKTDALSQGAIEIDDPFVKDSKGNAQKLVQLNRNIRLQRAKDTIQALKTISGGAMQTNNMSDVTPKFIILVSTTSGNHPFSHIVTSEGMNLDRVALNLDGLKEVLKDYKEQIVGTVFIGKRSGFLNEYNDELRELLALGDAYPTIQLGTINETIDAYCTQLENQFS
ncbi:type I-B CRISPR-associated protein Cas7/Cst2/DevR [Siphonobacter sp. BAB-5405]|uniref:type I-B CRISPR-associated protein Cas7/Cst2/DevR n=1 Tax=Siphonobacter sp. BAB-5405 TaxID=1864825 RepID=UPI001E509D0B|nr:type I-B CRISPR-associated protein Cas7/Cst2/DevR [Siphonobacter sp. BAB-5405]